jgi:hypothetical protein
MFAWSKPKSRMELGITHQRLLNWFLPALIKADCLCKVGEGLTRFTPGYIGFRPIKVGAWILIVQFDRRVICINRLLILAFTVVVFPPFEPLSYFQFQFSRALWA